MRLRIARQHQPANSRAALRTTIQQLRTWSTRRRPGRVERRRHARHYDLALRGVATFRVLVFYVGDLLYRLVRPRFFSWVSSRASRRGNFVFAKPSIAPPLGGPPERLGLELARWRQRLLQPHFQFPDRASAFGAQVEVLPTFAAAAGPSRCDPALRAKPRAARISPAGQSSRLSTPRTRRPRKRLVPASR